MNITDSIVANSITLEDAPGILTMVYAKVKALMKHIIVPNYSKQKEMLCSIAKSGIKRKSSLVGTF